MSSAAEILQDYLSQVIRDPERAVLDAGELPEEFRGLGRSLVDFCGCLAEYAGLAKALAKGNLNVRLPPRDNGMAAPLKALHATLRHLTWQTQQVAKGDYRQRVDFMGDFSDAFNTMIEQLDQRREALLEQIRAMMQSRSLYETLAGEIERQIIVTDADTAEVLFVSRGAGDFPGDKQSELLLWLKRQTEEMRDKSGIRMAELELSAGGEAAQSFSVSEHPLRWNQHNALAFVLTDIREERAQLRKLQSIANIDTLTQLNNRRYGMETLEKWVAEKRSFALCFIDIDNLKYVNDEYGHEEGDRYILSVAGALRSFSADAVACRIGGDEFILLAENWTLWAATERMESLRGGLLGGGARYEQSLSYGIIAVEPENQSRAEDLLAAADEKMYRYKRAYKLRRKRQPG